MLTDRRQVIAGTASLAIAARLPAACAATQAKQNDLGDTLDAIREKLGLPAVGAIAVSRDGVLAQGVAGVRRVGEFGLVPADAHWQLGSITKTFTATLAALLVDRGKLNWDTTLRDIYPEHARIMAPKVGDITIRQLVTHRSGMFGDDAFSWDGVAETNAPNLSLGERRQRGVVIALRLPLQFPPGERFSYSNRGYNTLGAALEKVEGRAYEDMIIQDIAKPLGIRSVIFGEPALVDPAREPWPHVHEGARWRPVSPVPRSRYGYHIFNPAGGISLTLEGFSRWMQAHLTGDMDIGLLSRPIFKLLYTPLGAGGIPAFGIGSWGLLGRSIGHSGTNTRNWAEPPDADGPRCRRVRCGQCHAFGQYASLVHAVEHAGCNGVAGAMADADPQTTTAANGWDNRRGGFGICWAHGRRD